MRKFVKYILVGFLSYGLKLLIPYLLTEGFGFWYFYAYLIALGVVILSNFLFNVFYVFKTSNTSLFVFVKYLISMTVFNSIDALLVKYLTENLTFYYLYSIIIVTTVIVVVKFFVYNKLVFSNKEKKQIKTVCFFGDFDRDYARNRVLLKGLKENNIEVILINDQSRGLKKYFNLIKLHRQVRNKYDLLLVGYSDSRTIVPLASFLTDKPLIWDAFYSLYDSWIFDRKLASPRSLKAWYYWLLDWLNCQLAARILLDTKSHIDYFKETFKIKARKFIMVLVGTDDEIFFPKEVFKANDDFLIHFHGKYIPLQGIEYIIMAAKKLEEFEGIKFRLIGSGQEKSRMEKLASELKVNNLEFLNKVSYIDLADLISQADVCLGIFGDSDKAHNVIPNKVYEAAAMGKAVISGETKAIKELFSDRENILLCRPADSQALADKILELKNEPELRQKIAKNSYQLFKAKSCPKVIVGDLLIDLSL